MNQDIGPVSMILFHRIVPLFPEATIRRAERQSEQSWRYPDGSIQLDSASQGDAVDLHSDLPITLFRQEGRIEDTFTRNLAPFPRRTYSIYYDGEYHRQLRREERFHAGPPAKVWPGEQRLDDLLFTVWFCRRPSEAVRGAFVQWTANWLHSVSNEGLWGERSVAAVVPEVAFRGKRADIRLDASQTGPHTLMYLILSAMEFGHGVAAVQSAVFNYDDPLARQTMINCLRETATRSGGSFSEDDERRWVEQEQGGPGPSLVLPLPLTGKR